MRMLKLLFLIDTLEVGGAERSLLDILSRFQTVAPVLCHIYPGETLKPVFQQAGIKVISLNISGKYSFATAVHEVLRLIREERPVILHSMLFRADIIGRISGKLSGLPVVNTFVNDTYSHFRTSRMTLTQRAKHGGVYLLDRLTCPFVTCFTANSEAVKLANCRALRILPSLVDVIYRGRDISLFDNASRAKEATALRGLNLPEDVTIILSVARLLDRKGQEEIIRAIPRVIEKYPQVRLLIAGEGLYRPFLEKLIAELDIKDNVLLLGTRHDIPQLLSCADIFVSAAHYEGLPGAVIEAMLSGIPLALSDMDVHREMVEDGITGRLFPLFSSSAIAATLIDLLDHPAEAKIMGSRAKKRAMELFDIRKIVSRHEELYSEVLEKWKRNHRNLH